MKDKVATTVHALREFEGEEVYFLLFDVTDSIIEYVASTTILNIIKYVRSHNLQSRLSLTKTMLLRGYAYKAEELPYDLDMDEVAYVIADDYDFADFETMDGCVGYIEEQMQSLNEDIENFAVLIGSELSTTQQHRIIERILYNSKVLGAQNA